MNNCEREMEQRQVLMASVRSLAEFNLSRQQQFESDRRKLGELVEESNQLKKQIEEKNQILTELSQRASMESTLGILQASAAQAEEESETVAQAFLSKTIDYQAFISQYIDKRKLAHLRRIKADRLRTSICSQQQLF